MSTVAATNLKNASSSVNNAVTTAGGDLTNAAGVSFMGGSKNLLYNGAMQVAQRGTSATGVSSTGYKTADRWFTDFAGGSGWTQSVEADGPAGSGLTKSLKMLCTTASASPVAGSIVGVAQFLEGQDCQRIAKGTASAQQLTLSFWVKSNVTGTYTVLVYDNNNNRGFSASYTISASATWEKKSIAVPADTTGSLNNDNQASLNTYFQLMAGTDYTSGGSLMSAWQSYSGTKRAVGQTNLAAATNNYWQITGVQLEVGPVATSFEFKSYGQELRECQRYFALVNVGNGGPYDLNNCPLSFCTPVTMRALPDHTLPASMTNAIGWLGKGNFTPTSASLVNRGLQNITLNFVSAGSFSSISTYSQAVWIGSDIRLSAEL